MLFHVEQTSVSVDLPWQDATRLSQVNRRVSVLQHPRTWNSWNPKHFTCISGEEPAPQIQ